MKKNIFIVLVAILFILVLMYLYDKKEMVINKEYLDYQNNIVISYPYFNNQVIDTYLDNYLNGYISGKNSREDLLFIDYDYEFLNDLVNLNLYVYQEKNNIIRKEMCSLEIDFINSKILKNKKGIDTGIEYDVYSGKNKEGDKKLIALTFDDGPNHNTVRVLDILEKYGVKATFFILGSNVKGNEGTIKRMSLMGMEIGNHLYSHKLLTKLKDKEITDEISRVDNLIFDITKRYPTLLRPSYGTVNKRIKSIVDKPIVIWNVDTLDWKYHNSKKIADRVFRDVSEGDIILMHDIYRATANSLEIIIPKLLKDGYKIVTVSELLYYNEVSLEKGHVYSNI